MAKLNGERRHNGSYQVALYQRMKQRAMKIIGALLSSCLRILQTLKVSVMSKMVLFTHPLTKLVKIGLCIMREHSHGALHSEQCKWWISYQFGIADFLKNSADKVLWSSLLGTLFSICFVRSSHFSLAQSTPRANMPMAHPRLIVPRKSTNRLTVLWFQ